MKEHSADLEGLKYPIGRFSWGELQGPREEWLSDIRNTPYELRRVVSGLNEKHLATPYRPGGWTVRQVVHHYADDHMNSYVRFKWALTEESPMIKGYSEALWAELPEARTGPIEPSLALVTALHERWVEAYKALNEPEWHRTFRHPTRGAVTMEQLAALYSWHGRHHVAQIRALRQRSGWGEE